MQMEKKCKSTDLKHLYFNFDGKKMKIFSKKIYLVFLTECTISLIHLCQHFFFSLFQISLDCRYIFSKGIDIHSPFNIFPN